MAKPANLSTVGIFARKGGAKPAAVEGIPPVPAVSPAESATPPQPVPGRAQEPPAPPAAPITARHNETAATAAQPAALAGKKAKGEPDDRIAMTYKAAPLQYDRMQTLIGIRGKPYRTGQDLMHDAIEAWLAAKGV